MEFASFYFEQESEDQVFDDSDVYNTEYTPYNDQDEDDEGDYPIVYYQIPPNKQKTQEDARISLALQERAEKIKQKRLEKEENQRKLQIRQDKADLSLVFSKVCRLTHRSSEVRECCYVQERDLLVVVLKDGKTLKMFSTLSFKAVMLKKCKTRINVVRYSSELGKLLLAGDDYYVEIFNLKNHQTETLSSPISGWRIDEVAYVKKMNAIAVGTSPSVVDLLSINLTRMCRFEVDKTYSVINEIISLHSEYLLITSRIVTDFTVTKKISVYSLQTKDLVESPDIKVAVSSYFGITNKSPVNVLTCLALLPGETVTTTAGFKLVQLTFKKKDKSLDILKIGPSDMQFESMSRVQNSSYFIMRTFETVSRVLLMKITQDNAQIVKVMFGSDLCIVKTHLFTKLRGSSLFVAADNHDGIAVYSALRKNKEESPAIEEDEEYFPEEYYIF